MPIGPFQHVDALTAAETACISPVVAGWIGADALASNVREELCRVLEGGRLNPATADRWTHARPLDLPGVGCHLAALSYPQENGGRPLVALYGLNAADLPAPALREIAQEAARAISAAAPALVRFFLPGDDQTDRPLHAAPWLVPGKRLFAFPVAAVQALPLPRGADRVTAEPAEDMGFYDEYAAHYLAWQRERPDLAAHVRVEPPEALDAHLRDGLLVLLRIDGRIGGVMAAHAWTECGLRGYRIAEEFIYPDFRGQGLAAAVQRRFIDRLDGAAGQIVYGWIHPLNTISMRTASRVGRVQVGGHFFVDLSAPR